MLSDGRSVVLASTKELKSVPDGARSVRVESTHGLLSAGNNLDGLGQRRCHERAVQSSGKVTRFGKIIIPIFPNPLGGVIQLAKQRVLVTGGAGFIGSEVVRQLAAHGFDVLIVDNLMNGKRENLEAVLAKNVELAVADIRDQKSMTSLFRGVDIVFHLACLGVRHSLHSPIENQEVNATATLGLLAIAMAQEVKRFVYISTSEVYGMVHTAPIAENHSTLPYTVYGASKLAGEAYTRAFWHTYGYPTVMLRPFNAYGPRCHHEGDSGEVIPRFMLRCLAGRPMVIFGDGTQTRDFTFVSDTAAGILAAGLSDASVGRTLNLGSGKEIEIQLLAKMISEVLGRPDAQILYTDPRPGDVVRLLSDSSKAKELLNFKTTVKLRDGLARLRDWYATQGESPEELLEREIERNWEVQHVLRNAS